MLLLIKLVKQILFLVPTIAAKRQWYKHWL